MNISSSMVKVSSSSVRRNILLSVILAVFVPLLVLVSYFLYTSYQEGIKQAEFNRHQLSQQSTSWLRSQLYDIQYKTAFLASNKAIGELPVNILLNQFTHITLQQFVEDNRYINAALISDMSEYVLEGYPNSVFAKSAQFYNPTTSFYFENDEQQGLPKLLMLSASSLPQETPSNSLYFVAPLYKELASVITPRKVTGALFVEVDTVALLKDLDGEYQSAQVTLQHDAVMWQQYSESGNIGEIVAEILPNGVNFNSAFPLMLTLRIDESQYLQRLRNNLLFVVTICVAALMFSALLISRLISRLTTPLNDLRHLSQQFKKGNYQQLDFTGSFSEFDETLDVMNNMASTIENQISALQQAKIKAEHSEAMKSQFLANMSHEIRTPMNGVMGLLGVLQQKVTTPEQEKLVSRISDAASTLLTIVNDILDLSKIEADKLHIESVECELKELLLKLNRLYAPQVKNKGLKLKLDVKELTHSYVKSDPVRINQILNNLVSNAIKFTHSGDVIVSVSNQTIANQEYLKIEVCDTGIGMSEEQLGRLFNLFEQGDNSTTRKYGGTGLGLSICKKLANLMGGDIIAQSEPEKGTTFTVTLRVELAEPPNEKVPNETSDTVDLSKFRVLVAEDNTINQDVLGYMLEETGISYEFADNGVMAIEKYQDGQFDLILMDVQMPEMDGVTAAIEIRKRDKQIPIVMQTANVMSEDIQRYTNLGCNAIVAKPIVKNHLFTVLRDILIHQKQHSFQVGR